jgi:hypothetical protein
VQFYDDLASLSEVELVPVDMSSLQLIDKSEAVATVTGTAGWEAIVRDTPALAFGDAWYSVCQGVYDVDTKGDVADAFQAITSGLNEFDVYRFVRAVVDGGYRGWLGLTEMPDGMTHQSNTKTTLKGLREELARDGHIDSSVPHPAPD